MGDVLAYFSRGAFTAHIHQTESNQITEKINMVIFIIGQWEDMTFSRKIAKQCRLGCHQ